MSDPAHETAAGQNAAIDLIRHKLESLYAEEPGSQQELQEADQIPEPSRSRHQEFMYSLSNSGKSLAEIQTDWHNYYVSLTDDEKHQVWQEFYAANARSTPYNQLLQQRDEAARAPQPAKPWPQSGSPAAVTPEPAAPAPVSSRRSSVADIKQHLLSQISSGGKLQKKHHLQSLAFGVATGLVVLFIFLFSFFNEFLIAPFIQPSRVSHTTPVIVDPASFSAGTAAEVIIPKINVEIPTDYSVLSTNETDIEGALNSGVVHYPTTVLPGQTGNAAFFGHSSNNIFNPGKYKFAFVLLHELVPGDTFYLTNDGKVYVYKVISRIIVDPSNVGVLGPVPNTTATATLITCDPPGTSLKRLVVVGEQISPDPAGDGQPSATPSDVVAATPVNLPGNGPTLLSRLWHSIF